MGKFLSAQVISPFSPFSASSINIHLKMEDVSTRHKIRELFKFLFRWKVPVEAGRGLAMREHGVIFFVAGLDCSFEGRDSRALFRTLSTSPWEKNASYSIYISVKADARSPRKCFNKNWTIDFN